MKLEGFTDEEDIMLFKEHLMKVFNVEPHVLDVRTEIYTRSLIKTRKRKVIGKATQSYTLKFSYKFVEELEDNIGLYSKHLHMA